MAATVSGLVMLVLLGLMMVGGVWAWKKKVCYGQARWAAKKWSNGGGGDDDSVLKTEITTLGAEGEAGVVAVEAANPMHNDGDGEEECGPPKKDGTEEKEIKPMRLSSESFKESGPVETAADSASPEEEPKKSSYTGKMGEGFLV